MAFDTVVSDYFIVVGPWISLDGATDSSLPPPLGPVRFRSVGLFARRTLSRWVGFGQRSFSPVVASLRRCLLQAGTPCRSSKRTSVLLSPSRRMTRAGRSRAELGQNQSPAALLISQRDNQIVSSLRDRPR